MGEVLTNYHNIEVPTSTDPYQLVGDIRKMGVSVGNAINAASTGAITEDPNVPGTALIGE